MVSHFVVHNAPTAAAREMTFAISDLSTDAARARATHARKAGGKSLAMPLSAMSVAPLKRRGKNGRPRIELK